MRTVFEALSQAFWTTIQAQYSKRALKSLRGANAPMIPHTYCSPIILRYNRNP